MEAGAGQGQDELKRQQMGAECGSEKELEWLTHYRQEWVG
jgi:hypothetical protein